MKDRYGFYFPRKSRLVTNREMDNSAWVYDFLTFVRVLCVRENVTPTMFISFIADQYRDLECSIVDEQGNEIFLDFSAFEVPEETLLANDDRAERAIERLREWIEDRFYAPCTPRPHIRKEARERVQVIATIIRAAYPYEALMWGRRPANDNTPQA